MAVHFKQRQAEKKSENLTQMQLAIKERKAREWWEGHISRLFARASTVLMHYRPGSSQFLDGVAYGKAVDRWEAECRSLIKMAKQSTLRYFWNKDWAEKGVLQMTARLNPAAKAEAA